MVIGALLTGCGGHAPIIANAMRNSIQFWQHQVALLWGRVDNSNTEVQNVAGDSSVKTVGSIEALQFLYRFCAGESEGCSLTR